MTYEVYTFVLHVLLNALVVDPLKQPPELIYASPMETSEEDVSLRVVPEMDEGRYSNIMVLTKKSGGGGGLGGGGLGDGGLGATHVLLIVSHELAGPVVASVHSYLA